MIDDATLLMAASGKLGRPIRLKAKNLLLTKHRRVWLICERNLKTENRTNHESRRMTEISRNFFQLFTNSQQHSFSTATRNNHCFWSWSVVSTTIKGPWQLAHYLPWPPWPSLKSSFDFWRAGESRKSVKSFPSQSFLWFTTFLLVSSLLPSIAWQCTSPCTSMASTKTWGCDSWQSEPRSWRNETSRDSKLNVWKRLTHPWM